MTFYVLLFTCSTPFQPPGTPIILILAIVVPAVFADEEGSALQRCGGCTELFDMGNRGRKWVGVDVRLARLRSLSVVGHCSFLEVGRRGE